MRTFDVDMVPIEKQKMVRDMRSKGVVSTDLEALQAYKDRKRTIENVNTAMEDIKSEINTLKDDMREIRALLVLLAGNEKE